MLDKENLKTRWQRGVEIAKSCQIVQKGDRWIVPSQYGHGNYSVTFKRDHPACTCVDFEKRGLKCKHIIAVEITLTKQIDKYGNVTLTKTKRITYSQDWQAYDNAQTNQKELFMKLLYDLCKQIPEPAYGFGRPKMPLSDMVFASALKVFTTFSFRRFATDIRTAKESGYVIKVPHYSTVALYMENAELTPVLERLIELSSLPLKAIETDFAVDSSGFSTSRFGRWFDHKYGKERDVRVWVKAHVMSGVKTQIISAVKLTTAYESDSKQMPYLLAETAKNFDVKEVSADKAYSSRNNLNLIDEMGATPFIPFKTNSTPKASGSSVWHKMYGYFIYRQDEFKRHYHQRSNAETVFSMVKMKFGDVVRSRTETAQINEVLLKLLCHNLCVVIQEMFELGIGVEF